MIRYSTRLSCLAVLAVASYASAAPSSWDVPSGDQGHYTYSSGQSDTGNFGSGHTYSEGFYFLPASQRAVGLNGSASATDTVSVILNAKPNQVFSKISSAILGDYSIFGVGGVDSTGTLRVTNLDTMTSMTAPLAFSGVATTTDSSADGVFNGLGSITLPAGWSNIRVELDSFVTADASSGSSLIQVKDAEISIQTAEIPVPAAALVAPLAAFIGWRARRKLGLAK